MSNDTLALERAVATAASRAGRIDALNELGWALRHTSPERARDLCRQAQELATSAEFKRFPYRQGIATSLTTQGFLAQQRGALDEAVARCMEASALHRALPVSRAAIDCDRILGWTRFFLGDTAGALASMTSALHLAHQFGDLATEAPVLDGLAIIYAEAGDQAEALATNARALKLAVSSNDALLEVTALNNQAQIYLKGGDGTAALAAAERSLQLARRLNAVDQEIAILDTLGGIRQSLGDLKGAVAAYRDSLDLSETAGLTLVQSVGSFKLGQVYVHSGMPDAAEPLFRRAIEHAAAASEIAVEADAANALAELLRQRGDLAQALVHYRRASELRLQFNVSSSRTRISAIKLANDIELAQRDAQIASSRNTELQRKLVESKLQERGYGLGPPSQQSLYDLVPFMVGTIELDEASVLLTAGNRAARHLFGGDGVGASPDLHGGVPLAPEVARWWRESAAASLTAADPVRFEYDHPGADGSRRLDVIAQSAAGNGAGIVRLNFVAEDLTDKRQIEAALRTSEARGRLVDRKLRDRDEQLALVIEGSQAGLWDWQVGSGEVECNERWAQMLGYRLAELLPLRTATLLELTHPEDLRRAERLLSAHLAGTTAAIECEARMRHRDGSWVWLLVSGKAVGWSDDGRPERMAGTCIDITRRMRAEAMLVESRSLLQTIVDTAPLRVFWKDRQLRYLGCNPAFARDAGKAGVIDVVGHDDYQMGWSNEADLYRADDQQVMATGVAKLAYEEPQTTPEGQTIWLRTSKVPLRNPAGEIIGVLGMYEDVTREKATEQALRSSEERFRNLATMLRLMCDNVPDMIWAKDLQKRYLFANKALCANLLRAQDTDEPLGRNDLFFALRERERHPADPGWHTFGELCQDSDALTLTRGTASQFDEFGNVGGRYLVLDVRKAPFRNEAGEVIGTVGSARDITDRIELEHELQRHRDHLEQLVEQRTAALRDTEAKATHILQSSADGLYGVDVEGRITFMNRAGCALLGYAADEVIGRMAHDIFHHSRPDGTPYPRQECPGHGAVVRGIEARVDDEVYWHADGHPIPVMYAVHPMRKDGATSGAVISFVDMSQQRAAERARQAALAAAENLARVRREFIANMSHEIRTPLNGVLGFARIGERSCDDREKSRDAFEKILASGNRLLGIINEILDFSKIEAGRIEIDRVEISPSLLVEESAQLVRDRATAKGLQFRIDVAANLPDRCLGDPLRIGQVLLNLLDNAVKFTERGSIELVAGFADDELVFRVVDTGIGIGAQQLERVFDPFRQADGSTTRKYGGTGLGLAISKRILELMGGRIRIESRPGAGTAAEFRLPFVAPAALPPAAAAESGVPLAGAPMPLAGMSVLVVDDDLINQAVLSEGLAQDGARVTLAGDGWEALDCVTREGAASFDIVLMDVQMPGIDGYETARRLRHIAPQLPIIAQTADALDETRSKCVDAGMVEHVAKPVDFKALIELLLRHTGRAANLRGR
jgi:PAS domain S-box-containing protein